MTKTFLFFLILLFSPIIVGQTTLLFQPINLAKSDTSYSIEKLRFYTSAISFKTIDGKIIQDSTLAHLIDIADSSSLNLEFPHLNRSTLASVNITIGTDSMTNIAGILEGDLDPINGMYWSWNTGYINFKIEGEQVVNAIHTSFEYHVGGYLPPYPTEQHITFELPPSEDSIVIQLDLHKLLTRINRTHPKSVLIPGKNSMEIAQLIQQSFTLEK